MAKPKRKKFKPASALVLRDRRLNRLWKARRVERQLEFSLNLQSVGFARRAGGRRRI